MILKCKITMKCKNLIPMKLCTPTLFVSICCHLLTLFVCVSTPLALTTYHILSTIKTKSVNKTILIFLTQIQERWTFCNLTSNSSNPPHKRSKCPKMFYFDCRFSSETLSAFDLKIPINMYILKQKFSCETVSIKVMFYEN